MSKLSKCASNINEIGNALCGMEVVLSVNGEKVPEGLVDAIKIGISCGVAAAQYEVEYPGKTDPKKLAISALTSAIDHIFGSEDGDDE